MVNFYGTADSIGLATGGGVVTFYESQYVASMGPAVIIGKQNLPETDINSPFMTDAAMYAKILEVQQTNKIKKFDKALFYSGSFPATIKLLKHQGTKVAYTCAAHDPQISREEHLKFKIDYDNNYPHLTDPALRTLYTQCFRDADLVICPSTHSAEIMKTFKCDKIKVIPHGCTIPEKTAPMPAKFTIGFLGQAGADKGLWYLFSAWNLMKNPNIDLKVRSSNPDTVNFISKTLGGYPADIGGRVKEPSELYNQLSVYVSASCTEGFGIPVLEAMAHGRPVICTKNTGASDLVKNGYNGFVIPNRDPYAMADCILELEHHPELVLKMGAAAQEVAKQYTWDKIGTQYVETLRNL